MSPERRFFVIGTVLAGTAVAAGAFGAHGLKDSLEPEMLAAFSTGARYQITHALALLVISLAVISWPRARLELGGWLLTAGTVVFSGSLYLMAVTGARALGAITPIGGVLLLAGWAVLAWRSARSGAGGDSQG